MAKVLVTGGAGFLGRTLVEVLRRQGDTVRVLDRASAEGLAADVDFRRGSVTSRAELAAAMEGVELLYHLAAIPHLWARDPAAFETVNHEGTRLALEAAKASGVRKVVHCSTEAILLPPKPRAGAIDERDPPPFAAMPGPYTRSKHRAEEAALAAAREGLDVTIVNPTVPIGDDPNLTPPTRMVAMFLTKPPPAHLDCVLNLVDARDVAEGMALAGERGRSGERYILGGENLRLGELLARLEALSGKRMPRRTIPGAVALTAAAIGEAWSNRVSGRPPPASREAVTLALRSAPLDNGKAMRELGYAPRPIDDVLRALVTRFA